jgi:hypothetical protein
MKNLDLKNSAEFKARQRAPLATLTDRVSAAADGHASAANHDRMELQRACTVLWVATLSLMTAFIHNTAPAHRHLIARKIAKNLSMLHREDLVFTTECRMIFNNLAQRWTAKAEQLAHHRGREPV